MCFYGHDAENEQLGRKLSRCLSESGYSRIRSEIACRRRPIGKKISCDTITSYLLLDIAAALRKRRRGAAICEGTAAVGAPCLRRPTS